MSIIFKNVGYSYDNANKGVFSGLNFELTKSNRLGIYGKRGSGKSTIVKLICSEIKDFTGSIKIDGKDLSDLKNVYSKTTILFQNPERQFVFPKLADEYKFIINSTSKKNLSYRINKLANYFDLDLEKFLNSDRSIFSLALGELRLIQIIFTLAQAENYLILDEPFLFLDESDRAKLYTYLSENISPPLLILSHDNKLLEELTNKIKII